MVSRTLKALVAALAALVFVVASAAASATPSAAERLAQRYSPIAMLKAQSGPCDSGGEAFGPGAVDALLGNPAIALRRDGATMKTAPTAADISGLGDQYELDFPGNPLRPGCTYEQDARRFGLAVPPAHPTAYAHLVAQADRPGVIALQYWFFYYFNDFANVHEGDWELVQLLFPVRTAAEALATTPVAVGYSQHSNGESAAWTDPKVQKVGGSHPVVYVARGSHASFYGEGLWLARGPSEGLGCDETRGPHVEVPLTPVLLPATPPGPGSPLAWMGFDGTWGEQLPSPFGGITGPPATPRWTAPITWQEGIRSASTPIPGDGGVVTGGFCTAVMGGSRAVLFVGGNPWVGGLALVLLLIVGIVLVRRTSWSRVPLTPVVRERCAGQMIRSALALIRRAPLRLMAVGLVFLPVGLLAAGAQWLILQIPFMGTLLDPSAGPDAVNVVGAMLLGAPAGLIAYAVAIALVALRLRAEQQGAPSNARALLRGLWAHARAMVRTLGMAVVIIALLAATLVGIPWAVWRLVDFQLLTPVVVLEDRSGRDARARSRALVRGARPMVMTVGIIAGLIPVVVAPALAMPLLLVSGLPLPLVDFIGSVFAAALTPLAAVVVVLLYGARAAVSGAGVPGAAAPRPAPRTPRRPAA